MTYRIRLAVKLLALAALAALCLLSPRPAAGNPLTGALAITAEGNHTCALMADSGVKCWGSNGIGQLGNGGTPTSSLTPVDVLDGPGGAPLTGAASLDAGWLDHTCVLTAEGGVKCWGWSIYGKLGDGTTALRTTPVDVCQTYDQAVQQCTEILSDVSQVSAGAYHTCAVTTAGGVKCWGIGFYVQPGGPDRLTPVDVAGLESGVVTVSAGSYHTCALMAAGTVKCWGLNFLGLLGDGTEEPRIAPVDVCADATCSAPLSGVVAISAGWAHTCALLASGGLVCWGYNLTGQLGSPLVPACDPGPPVTPASWPLLPGPAGTDLLPCSTTPVAVTGLSSGVVSVDTGQFHTCAVTTSGAAKCWGWNAMGVLGNGASGGFEPHPEPLDVAGLGSGVSAVSAGSGHTCALTSAGGVKCWGGHGPLGAEALEICPDPFIVGRFVPCSTTPLDVLQVVKPTPTPTATATRPPGATRTATSTPTPSATPTPDDAHDAQPTPMPPSPSASAQPGSAGALPTALPATGAGGPLQGRDATPWALGVLIAPAAASLILHGRRKERPP